jgi:hypothetical protein
MASIMHCQLNGRGVPNWKNLLRTGDEMKPRLVIMLLLFTGTLSAQDVVHARRGLRLSALSHVGHYIRTHKELLAADTLMTLSLSADVGSSVHCQSVSLGCVETACFLPTHPNELQIEGDAAAKIISLISLNHWLFRVADRTDPPARHLIWFWTIPIAVTEFVTVRSNVATANELETMKRVGR